MEAKQVEFENIYDIYAARVIFEITPGMDEKRVCWDIYNAIKSDGVCRGRHVHLRVAWFNRCMS